MNSPSVKCEILEILKLSGIKAGDAVLDFGCGPGEYTVPAAAIVGNRGIVYAFDTDMRKLENVKRKAEDRKLENVVVLQAARNGSIGVEDESLAVVLLFDVLHEYYFPSVESRRDVLCDIHRVLKPNALLLVHPTHIDQSKLVNEIQRAGFQFQDTYTGNLMHDGNCRRSSILTFRRLP